MSQPEPSECSSPIYSTSQCSSGFRATTNREKAQLWKIEVTWSLSSIWVGQQWLSLTLTQAAQNSDNRHPVYHSSPPNTCQVSMQAPPALRCRFTTGWGLWRLRGAICCEEKKGLEPEAASAWSKGNNYWCLHRQLIRDNLDLCLWLPQV